MKFIVVETSFKLHEILENLGIKPEIKRIFSVSGSGDQKIQCMVVPKNKIEEGKIKDLLDDLGYSHAKLGHSLKYKINAGIEKVAEKCEKGIRFVSGYYLYKISERRTCLEVFSEEQSYEGWETGIKGLLSSLEIEYKIL